MPEFEVQDGVLADMAAEIQHFLFAYILLAYI